MVTAVSQYKYFYATILSPGMNWVCRIFDSLKGCLVIGSLISFLVAITCTYTYLFPESTHLIIQINEIYPFKNSSISKNKCNIFEGSWLQDKSYPLYNAAHCPFSERGFSCLLNGRKDHGYTQWRWTPKNCEIPKFDVSKIIEQLRGKRVVFVGDSLGRTQWESFICMLMTGVDDKKSVYEINGREIKRNTPFLGVRFDSLNIRVDFYRSVFLMRTGEKPKGAPDWVKMTLSLDKLDGVSKEWIDSDILMFNSGGWWNIKRLFYEMGCHFQEGNSLRLEMSVEEGFRRAMNTWASWADTMINPNRTRVFFRTVESTHWSGINHDQCYVTNQPSSKKEGWDRKGIPLSDIIIDQMKKVKIPVTVMNQTPMTAYRSDGHVGNWSDQPWVPDCGHWCIPGVPDTWNELLFSYILPTKEQSY